MYEKWLAESNFRHKCFLWNLTSFNLDVTFQGKSEMKIDPSKIYLMPLIIGPIFDKEKRISSVYGEVQYLTLQYQTDSDVIQELLPECYQPAEKPLVTVLFGYFNGVDFMAGRGYRIATVSIAARFDGTQDHVEGDYVLVMFEDDTLPILTGRELHGIPKVYADISPVRTLRNSHLRCDVSLWGHLLFGIDLDPLKEQNRIVRSVASKRINGRPTLGYKYSPSLEGPPDAAYPTILRNDTTLDQLWLGNAGQLFFSDAGDEDIGISKKIVDVLKMLPVRQVTQTSRFYGSQVLRTDLSGRLK